MLLLLFAGVGAAVPLRRWVVEPIYVASASMVPELPVGSRRLADKVTLRLRPPSRGDIVLFPSPTGEALSVGKRVIALPGETIEIRDRRVFIDGLELSEPYAVHLRPAGRPENLGPLKVPPGAVFVLGDNRDESEDSSNWKDREGRPIHYVPIAGLTGLVRPMAAAGAVLTPLRMR